MPTLADLQNQRNQYFKQRGEQAQGQIGAQTQGNVSALQRRFTSMGAANTGAALAAEQKARDEGLAQQRQAQTDIAGQQLQAGEGDIGRAFQSEEARLGREAQLGEAEKARQFQRSMAEQDIGFKQKLADVEQQNKLKEMDLAYQQFQLDKDTTEFNKRMAELNTGGGGGRGGPAQHILDQAKPYLTGSGAYGVLPSSPQEALLQGALGPVSVVAQPVKDIARRIGIKI